MNNIINKLFRTRNCKVLYYMQKIAKQIILRLFKNTFFTRIALSLLYCVILKMFRRWKVTLIILDENKYLLSVYTFLEGEEDLSNLNSQK